MLEEIKVLSMLNSDIYILGISAFYHDSAACLLRNGEIIAAAQEERFTRKKHDKVFPSNSIVYCLKEGHISPNDITEIVFYEKPFIKLDRLFKTYLAYAPYGLETFLHATKSWLGRKINQRRMISNSMNEALSVNLIWSDKIKFSEHHYSHAASCFFPSPFERAAVLTLDGVGEWATASISIGNGKSLEMLKEIHFPHSLGLLYSAFTYYLGFKVNSGEYKIMGLAPYGEPKFSNLIKKNLIHIAEDGSFRLDMSYFDFATGFTMTNDKFNKLFGGAPRTSETDITQREMDLAASIQEVTEEIVIKIAKSIAHNTGENNLCLAGGVALNCVANGKLLKEKIFKNIWVQPAAGDAGGALGAALASWYLNYSNKRVVSSDHNTIKGSFLGPSFSNDEIEKQLIKCGAKFKKLNENDLLEIVTDELADEKAIGWMQGRMEFGPRALGSRSIIADPRSKLMQKQLNLKVKYRESFRPFAPSVLKEDVSEWFDHYIDSPYMLFVADIKNSKRLNMTKKEKKLFGIDKLNVPRSQVPAITHVDYTARIQTVHKETNPIYHNLIKRFKKKTDCPILVNTSFNVRGEPIVCTPTDAFKCFMGTELDVLVIGNYLLLKNQQRKENQNYYYSQFELD